jgi:16S rRNA (cytosine967-C5)-methyltransferase
MSQSDNKPTAAQPDAKPTTAVTAKTAAAKPAGAASKPAQFKGRKPLRKKPTGPAKPGAKRARSEASARSNPTQKTARKTRARQRGANNIRPTARCLAVITLKDILGNDLTLDHAIDKHLQELDARDRAFAQHLVYATLRRLNSLQAIAALLLNKPLPRKYFDVELLLLLGLLQLWDSHVAHHAAVSATVNVCNELGKNWARNLINAALRRFQRDQALLLAQSQQAEHLRYSTPQWLLAALQQDWPQRWLSIVQQGLRPAPMWLRVNLAKISRDDYLRQLSAQHIAAAAGNSRADILLRQPLAVEQLPGFAQGLVSVQDSAAQWAATILAPAAGHKVLDLCAAPGGKSCQLLEQYPGIQLTSVDLQAQRLQRLQDNYQRLGVHGEIICADALAANGSNGWWDQQTFDRILLDAPCSATGVIRRHPDIKWRLQTQKLDNILQLQQQLLQSAWRMLKPGGHLLYSTCSILKSENDAQIQRFMQTTPDAQAQALALEVGQATEFGWQCLSGDGGGDGMYFGLLKKPLP